MHFVLKHVIFPGLVETDLVKSLCYGECHGVMWHGNAKSTKKAFYHMVEKWEVFKSKCIPFSQQVEIAQKAR